MDKPAATNEIEIFRAGTYTAMDGSEFTVTAADLAAIAERYDPAKGEAPLVVGHPKIDAPAYGWVASLREDGGLLLAKPHQVDPAFASLVSAGRFKKRSASFFRPGSAGNPTPDALYLRHVGFLGATPPAVHGLRDASFSADDDAATVEFSASDPWWAFGAISRLFRRIRDDVLARDGVEKADQLLSQWEIDAIADAARPPAAVSPASFASQEPPVNKPTPPTADLAARETALSTREQEIATREAALREQERQTQRKGVADFCAGLVQQGRLLPAHQPQIVELLAALEAQPQSLDFAGADGVAIKTGAADALRTFLAALPVQVDMSERGGGADPATSVDFAAPANTVVNRDRLALHAQAEQYQRQNPNTSYLDAVRAVGG
jgi:hypothetical protein